MAKKDDDLVLLTELRVWIEHKVDEYVGEAIEEDLEELTKRVNTDIENAVSDLESKIEDARNNNELGSDMVIEIHECLGILVAHMNAIHVKLDAVLKTTIKPTAFQKMLKKLRKWGGRG